MKLNRKQITTSLECCHSTNITDCRNCAYRDTETEFGCTNLLVKDALSLIRELIEENTKLSKSLEKELVDSARVYDNYCRMIVALRKKVDTARTDTVREMQARLKGDLFYKCGDINYSEVCDTRKLIDQIAKEMLEDNE